MGLNNLYGWANNFGSAISQKLQVNGFEWAEDISQLNGSFIKSCNEKSDEGYFFEDDVQYPEKLHDLHND